MRDTTDGFLGAYTTLRLGGDARRLVEADDRDDAVAAVRAADAAGEPLLVLAGGSNVVIGDAGFPGTALLLRSTGETVTAFGDRLHVTVDAGQPWDELVARAVVEGWQGFECLSGIPGSAGATPIQNVGAYGQEVAETIVAVEAYDRIRGEVRSLAPAECGFAYRTSVFKGSDRWLVLAVTYALTPSQLSGPVRYAELARTLGVAVGETVPLVDVRAAVLTLRRRKGMVLDDTDPDTYSVGSFFTNPILDAEDFAALQQRCVELLGAGVEPPAWPGTDGTVKTSAAWLIENAGFRKGHSRDGVGISTKHTLALTNRGTGTTTALLDLAREIRDGVDKTFGVALHPEPVLVNATL